MVMTLDRLTEEEIRPGFYSIHNPDCLTLNDKLLYHSGQASLEHINKVENHALACPDCYSDLYKNEKTLKEMAIKLNREIKYE